MTISDVPFWPGARPCARLGGDSKASAGLIRWTFNMAVSLFITLTVVRMMIV